jgi:SRSO17 transposase
LLDGDGKSMQRIAARLVEDTSQVEAMRQRLQECVVIGGWRDDDVRGRLATKVDRELPAIEAFVVDDTGFAKQGKHSVGVHRQYSGTLGRTENCQVATSLHLAGERGSACIAFQLYLPEPWAADQLRRNKAGVPTEITFKKKWEIALDQLDAALQWGVRRHVVLADAGYGDVGEFRAGLSARGLHYVAGVQGSHLVWEPGSNPQLPPYRKGRPSTRFVDTEHPPVSIAELALRAGRGAYRKVTWREGSRGPQSSQFLCVRIRSAAARSRSQPPGDEQWLICEWPLDEPEPTKYWLSNLPANTPRRRLVQLAKLRWRVERDYRDLKQEIGLDDYEGRTWRGFHHHATLCSVAHAFLALQRALFPPDHSLDSAGSPASSAANPVATNRLLPALSSNR